MELEQKKEHALRCIKLGMTLEDSLFIAECTQDEIETCLKDKQFLDKVRLTEKIEELDLLRQHNIAMQIAASKGNTRPIEWKLGKLNPGRYESKTVGLVDVPMKYSVEIVGVKGNG